MGQFQPHAQVVSKHLQIARGASVALSAAVQCRLTTVSRAQRNDSISLSHVQCMGAKQEAKKPFENNQLA
eukprot:m.538407 g.538407  ORF g.538407 m.538407 type:complete len:70 (+) comp22084_c0_seq2:1495-1704(+)